MKECVQPDEGVCTAGCPSRHSLSHTPLHGVFRITAASTPSSRGAFHVQDIHHTRIWHFIPLAERSSGTITQQSSLNKITDNLQLTIRRGTARSREIRSYLIREGTGVQAGRDYKRK
ncbi:hypothetical protein EYF80_028808 [Liparis tanakae]|uniref:Uncharacterized protein n=1 Tax=Liparis tanakae TaxID=230148 RepID=A0A4Z2H682_9TELE|nr:hypothetical protein EYF80_028808 [Liparis tanakae]